MEPHAATDSAFLDIATNLLAVILIVTLFALIGGRPQSSQATHPLAPVPSEPRFDEPRRELFPPFSRFYFVRADHVLPWDQDAVLDELAAHPQARSGHTWQGRYQWQPEPLVTRDIDSFRLQFFLDPVPHTEQTPEQRGRALARQDLALLLDELRQAKQQHSAAVFLVWPDGMNLFAALYPKLREHGLRFRWFAQDPDQPLLIGRDPAQFTHYVSYW
ncbi:hypothetical protein [Rhabdochromatium marinum]|uniref:hypothetical protein n=1 Tax=Rhabdochromatium marinum TaxID=48729 RepID=UPI001905CF33|nr:hypothetical protein [Rhabdochromatium marinum]MBK1648339.1 hypothetical protein [Rhabdochromatium marinum]